MAGGSADRDADVARQAARDVSRRVLRLGLVFVAVLLAFDNLGLGVILGRDWTRTSDFEQVMGWSAEWLRGGNPYAAPDSLTDYPPNALVMLAPLAAMSLQAALSIWIALNLALSAAIGWMASRLVRATIWAMAFAALVIALPPFRTLNQFSIASFAPALAGFLLAGRHPIAAGALIGVSLIKPHIGGPVLLWAIAARRWKTAATAIVTPLALVAVYLLRAQEAPGRLLGDYLLAIARTQSRPAGDLLPSQTSLQPLLEWMPLPAVSLQLMIAALLTVPLALIWWRWRDDEELDRRFVAAACLLSLLAFRHLGYNLLLAIPALAFVWTRRSLVSRALAAVSFFVLIASPPTLWRHVLEPRGWSTPFDAVVPHSYRAVLVALFLAVALQGRDRKAGN